MLNGGKPAIVIEAKKLGTPLYSAAEQSVTYCVNDGIRYFVATDGRKWDVYETHRPVPLAEKKIVSFDITDSPADVCLDALVLWRRSVQSGVVRKARTPVVESQHESLVAVNQPEPVPEPVETMSTDTTAPVNESSWQPLTQIKPVKRDKAPPQIRFPDGSIAQIKSWVDIPVEIVSWLDQESRLDETAVPIEGDSTRYILSGNPVHKTGRDFWNPKQAGRFYIEGDHSGASHVRGALKIIKQAGKGVKAEQFSVRLS